MSISIYDISIPVLMRGLTNLSVILDKGAAYAEAKKFDPASLLQARLFPDMFPVARQVQIACDTAKGGAARLAGIENPKHEDNETTFAELQARIAKTKAFVGTVQAAHLQNAESREIVLTFPSNTLTFNGLTYLTAYVMPNFYFHSSMAYALLRHNGIEVGKRDFLGAIQ
jgi:hypothetical protein